MAQSPEEKVTYFAETDARNKRIRFGIKAKDRTRHVYVIGKTGMGKSTLLENMAVQDIENGNGFAFIDPHGKTAELLLEYIPEHRKQDVLYFAPFDMEYPIAFNIMEDVGPDKRHLVLSGLMSTFKKIWVDAWSARMEYILSNTILALLEYPDATLLSVNRMYSDKNFRKKVVDNITDVSVKSFWVDEFAKYTDRFTQEATPAIQNKVGQFTSNPVIRNIIGQAKSTFDLRKMMDEKKIIIVNLSKGRVGEVNANLLGSMLITKIYLAAMSRADVDDSVMQTLPNFYLYVDEFQSFANESFADILSEARKYKLNLTIAHQYVEQMSEEVRAAVFGNVGTMVTFRVGATDAEAFEKEFAPQFTAEDIVNLDKYQLYLRLMIDGVGSAPFSATSLPPMPLPSTSSKFSVIDASREQFASPRSAVEKKIIADMHSEAGDQKPKEGGSVQGEKKQQRPQQQKTNGDRNQMNGSRGEKPAAKEEGVSLGKAIQEALVLQSKAQQKEKQQASQQQKPPLPVAEKTVAPVVAKNEESQQESQEQQVAPQKEKPPHDPKDGFSPLSRDMLKNQIGKEKSNNIEQQHAVSTPTQSQAPAKPAPKTATKAHLDGLRAALGSVIKTQQAAKKPEAPKPVAPVSKQPIPEPVVQTPASQNVVPEPPKQEVPTTPNIPVPRPPRSQHEIPKSVLENILNGEE